MQKPPRAQIGLTGDAKRALPSHGYVSAADVAHLAGVSQSAVSRTFTPGASVFSGTRSKVLRAANDLGYRANFLPQALMRHREPEALEGILTSVPAGLIVRHSTVVPPGHENL
jgi:DNA-binding LacI/PurR family transcriptional regulator